MQRRPTATSINPTNMPPELLGPEMREFQAPNDNFTIVHGESIKLAGGRDFVMSKHDTITLVRRGSAWHEVSRSVNTS